MFTANSSKLTKSLAPATTAAAVVLLSSSYLKDSTTTRAEAATTSLDKIKAAIANVIETDAAKRGDGTALTGTFVRLAWHSSGTYSKEDGSGGSDGARMRFPPEATWGANKGLKEAREALEPVKDKFPEISYADLYTLSGVVAIEESGGPTVPFRIGRVDHSSGETSPPHGRLPHADEGTREKTKSRIKEIFYRMGFNDQEIVALSGAHALGRCHTNITGYWGPWTSKETTMSNEYFKLLLEERWTLKKTHEGKPWTGKPHYENPTGKLTMLPSDIMLIEEPEFKKYVEMYAKDEKLFFKDFAKAFSKLLELGVQFPKPWWKFF